LQRCRAGNPIWRRGAVEGCWRLDAFGWHIQDVPRDNCEPVAGCPLLARAGRLGACLSAWHPDATRAVPTTAIDASTATIAATASMAFAIAAPSIAAAADSSTGPTAIAAGCVACTEHNFHIDANHHQHWRRGYHQWRRGRVVAGRGLIVCWRDASTAQRRLFGCNQRNTGSGRRVQAVPIDTRQPNPRRAFHDCSWCCCARVPCRPTLAT